MTVARRVCIAGAITLACTAEVVLGQVVVPIRDLVIGTNDDTATALTAVPPASIALADSLVVIAQPIDGHVKIFHSDGRPLTRFGRRRNGPGEFASMLRIGRVDGGGGLWVHDPRNKRVTLFDEAGRLVRGITMHAFGPAECLGMIGTDTLILVRSGAGQLNGEVVAIAVGGKGNPRRLVAFEARRTGASVRVPIPGVGRFTATNPLDDNPLFTFSSENALLLVERRVARSARRDSFSVAIIRSDGRRVQRWFGYTPLRANDEVIANAIDEIARGALAFPGTGLPQYPRARLHEAIRDSLMVPDYVPPVSEALIGTDGRVWLRREAAGATVRWEVISPDLQRVEARFDLPATSSGRAAGPGVIWVLEHDEFDVPLIVRYRIPGLPGGNAVRQAGR